MMTPTHILSPRLELLNNVMGFLIGPNTDQYNEHIEANFTSLDAHLGIHLGIADYPEGIGYDVFPEARLRARLELPLVEDNL